MSVHDAVVYPDPQDPANPPSTVRVMEGAPLDAVKVLVDEARERGIDIPLGWTVEVRPEGLPSSPVKIKVGSTLCDAARDLGYLITDGTPAPKPHPPVPKPTVVYDRSIPTHDLEVVTLPLPVDPTSQFRRTRVTMVHLPTGERVEAEHAYATHAHGMAKQSMKQRLREPHTTAPITQVLPNGCTLFLNRDGTVTWGGTPEKETPDA